MSSKKLWPAAGGALINKHNEILLREPTNHFGGAVWTFPKGQIDKGESVKKAALREVLDETGYTGKIIQTLGTFQGTSSITTYFLMINPKRIGSPDIETNTIKWISIEEAEDYIKKSTNVIVRNRDLAILEKIKITLNTKKK